MAASGNKIEEACNIGDVVLIHTDNTPRINLIVDIIDSFMSSRDVTKKFAKALMVQMERHQNIDDRL